ncbi:RHS repeat domain-containing protein [Desulfobulbus rhabdoformis]|uniref:RHS repeat domain-containing protein n=1 Tax=Desulfobulbus rhabdoformis TaxID=34032 RepID=UPI0030844E4A
MDLFNGSVVLTHEDLVLPGDGGLDLKIFRTYNTDRITSYTPGFQSSLGKGWDITFGSLHVKNSRVEVALPDGTKSVAYKMEGGSSYDYITKDFWRVCLSSGSNRTLTLTDGTKFIFEKSSGSGWYYATKIEKGGNVIEITYLPRSHKLDQVIYRNSGEEKCVNFEYFPNTYRISSISWGDFDKKFISYTYTSNNIGLETVSYPTGEKWEYEYTTSPKYIIKTVTTPYGGVCDYTFHWVYKRVDFCTAKGQISLTNKTVTDNDHVFSWEYEYNYESGEYDYTIITDSDNRTEEYRYFGFKSSKSGECYKYGLQQAKIVNDNGFEETTEYTWSKLPEKISTYRYIVQSTCGDDDVFVPVLLEEVVTKNGTVYTKNFSDFDEYGNVGKIEESGLATRTITRTFWKNITDNMVKGFVENLTIKGGDDTPRNFSIKYFYYDSGEFIGKLRQIIKYGVKTSYTYDQNSNIASITNANNKVTNYNWSNGSVNKIDNGLYAVTRDINWDGTVKSETNGRGFTTHYDYDDNMRLVKITPPIGKPTTITYKLTNGFLTEKVQKRGGFSESTHYDGLGRSWKKTNSLGVETKNIYRANGQVDYSISNIGDDIYFDSLGRISRIAHKDNNEVTYQYTDDSNFSIIDESGRSSFFKYSFFANPDEKFLISVQDAQKKYTYYDYNVLGSIVAIRKDKLKRIFRYDSKNFLTSEFHPESGTTSYTARDNLGNLKQKIESGKTVNYAYDALSRLTSRRSGPYYQNFTYDRNNNILKASSPNVTITYSYDAADRVLGVSSNIHGVTKKVAYHYDGNDNLTRITYPSGTIVNYAYNALNQVTRISGFGGWVGNIHYHTTAPRIGLLKDYTRTNGQTLTYNWDRRRNILNCGPPQYRLRFGYDERGNLTQYWQAGASQSFTYDALNRLRVFRGPWGEGAYTYDSMDNMTKFRVGTSATTYTFDANSNRLIKENSTPVKHNGGNVARIGNLSLTYDPFNNQILAKENTSLLGRYGYDAFNNRVRKNADNQITHYYYDTGGNILSEMTGAGKNLYDYVYLNNILVARVGKAVSPAAATGSVVSTAINAGVLLGGATMK